MEKHKKNHITTVNLKYQLQHGMINLNHMMDHIQYYFEYISKKQIEIIGKRIYVRKIKNICK